MADLLLDSSADSDSDNGILDNYPSLFVRVKDLPVFGTQYGGLKSTMQSNQSQEKGTALNVFRRVKVYGE